MVPATGGIRLALAAALCLISGTVVGDVVNGPADAFSLTLPGQWTLESDEEGGCSWSGKGQEQQDLSVIATAIELDAQAPIYPQLVEVVRQAPDAFANPLGFTETSELVMDVDRPMLVFSFDGPDGVALQACAAAFPVGDQYYAVIVIGEPSPFTWASAREIIGSAAPPVEGACATGPPAQQASGRPLLGVPPSAEGATDAGSAGWLMKQTADGSAVQIFEAAQPGAVGEMCLIGYAKPSAAEFLREGFYKPLAAELTVESIARSADDSAALLRYKRMVGGTAFQGEVIAEVGPGVALMANIASPEAQFAAKAMQVKQLLQVMAQRGSQPAPAFTPPDVPLQPAMNPDRTARISVPAGWKVGGMKGILEVSDDAGLSVVVGLHGPMADQTVAARLAQGGLDPRLSGVPFVDYVPSAQAFPAVMTCVSALGGVPITDMRMLSSQPVPNAPGFAAFEATWRDQLPGGPVRDRHGVGIITTQPPLDGQWSYYLSLLSAPQGKLESALPLLLAIYRSASWTSQFGAEVAGQIRQDQEETANIIAGVARRRWESSDTASRMWGAVIRGEEGIIDPGTGERRSIGGLEDMRRWIQDSPDLNLNSLRPMNFDEWRDANF